MENPLEVGWVGPQVEWDGVSVKTGIVFKFHFLFIIMQKTI